jgi:hypothetical protein
LAVALISIFVINTLRYQNGVGVDQQTATEQEEVVMQQSPRYRASDSHCSLHGIEINDAVIS